MTVPSLALAVGGLKKGSGGIAGLSRQVLKVLLGMQHEDHLRLELFVLDESGPEQGDPLFESIGPTTTHWYGGKRLSFTLGLLRSRADVTLYDHVGLARMQGLLPKSWSKPYLLLIHSVEIWNNNRADYYRTARKASLLIANSAYTARKARSHYPDLPDIRVCWPGRDEYLPDEPPEAEAFPQIGPHAMLIVGRLDTAQRHKGHEQLIDAMPHILAEIPDAQLIIAGGGDDRERLEARAEANGVAGKVEFLGRVDEQDLQQLYTGSALFVMPSDGDGFGLVFLEAMMHRLPCVGLEQGAAAEIFEGGRCGVLVNRDDLSGMAHTLAGLLADEQTRRAIGDAGHERFRDQFTAQKHADRFRTIMADLLDL